MDKLVSIESTEQFGYLIQATQKMKKSDKIKSTALLYSG